MNKTLEQSCVDIYKQKCGLSDIPESIRVQIHQYLVLNFHNPEKIVGDESVDLAAELMKCMSSEELECFFDNYEKKHEVEEIRDYAEICAARRYKNNQIMKTEEFGKVMERLNECVQNLSKTDKYMGWLENMQWEISTNMRFAIGEADTVLQSVVDTAWLL